MTGIDENAGDALFRREARFAAGADTPGRIPPPTLPEVAFAGRSNVGKSSLINALTNRRALARASNTPGRTQQINFFDLGGAFFLVDLPGYGYAAASKTKAENWNEMVQGYLCSRPTLRRVFVLVDARHGLKDSDRDALAMLEDARVPYTVVLTKADKISADECHATVAQVEEELRQNASCAALQVFAVSSSRKSGLERLRGAVAAELVLM